MAVRREHHRKGVGRALVQDAEQEARRQGVEFLQVKTLGTSRPSPEYEATRQFYEAVGYRPLEEFPADELWPGNPCLLMVKHLSCA
jgi:predicted N-acetyltransferase YhbS